MTDRFYSGIVAGSTDVSVPVTLRYAANSVSLIGMDYANVELHYMRQGSNTTIVTATEMTNPDNVHQDGGFIEANATSIPGLYRVDWPDAAFAAGADWVVLHTANVSASFHDHTLYPLQQYVNVTKLDGNAQAATNMANTALSITVNTAKAGTLSTIQMSTNLDEATDDHFIGKVITWTSGALFKQSAIISDYENTNGLLTFSEVTEAPTAGDSFVIT